MKAKEVIQLLKADGWVNTSNKGSHRHFTHAIKTGKVTVPYHGSDDLSRPTLMSIFKQAGWK